MHDIRFTPDELSTLREHGVVLFANRVIFDAQPPMPQAQIAAVQALCAGPIPGGLLALWEVTAGGQLDYDLSLEMNGNLEGISWTELFWNGSDSYHDLQGWIDHEQELAQEAAEESGEPWSGKLTHLPFGGFEYTDRIYAVVEPGAEHGQIVAWKKGLPPAWTHALHEDSVNTIASDLMSAFAALHLDEDPLAPTSDYFAGQTLLEYLDDRHEEHGLDLDLMDKLVAFYSRAGGGRCASQHRRADRTRTHGRAAGQRRGAQRGGHRQVRGLRCARERAPDRGGLRAGRHRRGAGFRRGPRCHAAGTGNHAREDAGRQAGPLPRTGRHRRAHRAPAGVQALSLLAYPP
jgi:hypothetical protein